MTNVLKSPEQVTPQNTEGFNADGRVVPHLGGAPTASLDTTEHISTLNTTFSGTTDL